MADQTEQDEWPLCEPPEPPASCRACGEPFTDARPFSQSGWICPECDRVYDQLERARYDHDAHWPGNFALAALDLDKDGQHRAAALYVALGWCDPRANPAETLRSLLTDGAKPAPEPQRVRHEWARGDRMQVCVRCGAIEYDPGPSARNW